MKTGTSNPVRQQMINMMYLVLTALLALNVSADILKAFAVVNMGLGSTSDQYEDRNDGTMSQFRQLYEADKKKAEKNYNQALDARKEADAMFAYLQQLKEEVALRSGGWADSRKSTVIDDQDLEASSNLFINKRKGEELRTRLENFGQRMKELANNDPRVNIAMSTGTPPASADGTRKNWSEYYFEGVPSIAAITLLTKFQNDIRKAENEVTTYNLSQVNADLVPVNAVRPIVQLDNPAVYEGQKLNARIMLGAYSTTQDPDIYVEGQKIDVKEGVGEFQLTAQGTGEKSFQGKIMVRKPGSSEMEAIPFNTTYQVFKGQAAISAEKMNVLYARLDNPLAVSVPGYLPEDVVVKTSGGGTMRQTGPGKYLLVPDGSQKKIMVTAYAKMPDNSLKQMGQQEYKIRNVPKVRVLYGTKEGGRISRGEIRVMKQINATLGQDFIYDGLQFKVKKFKLTIVRQNGRTPYFRDISGDQLEGEAYNEAVNSRPGDMIIISEVEAVGPNGIVQIIDDGCVLKVE